MIILIIVDFENKQIYLPHSEHSANSHTFEFVIHVFFIN